MYSRLLRAQSARSTWSEAGCIISGRGWSGPVWLSCMGLKWAKSTALRRIAPRLLPGAVIGRSISCSSTYVHGLVRHRSTIFRIQIGHQFPGCYPHQRVIHDFPATVQNLVTDNAMLEVFRQPVPSQVRTELVISRPIKQNNRSRIKLWLVASLRLAQHFSQIYSAHPGRNTKSHAQQSTVSIFPNAHNRPPIQGSRQISQKLDWRGKQSYHARP